MPLNEARGNMYPFINATWNTIKGQCPHLCHYCYCRKWGKQKPVRFDIKELKTDLGEGNFIFVGSSCDMLADDITYGWIWETLQHCNKYPKNKYLFQSKNPRGFDAIPLHLEAEIEYVLCTTIETNRQYKEMGNAPTTFSRAIAMANIPIDEKHITIEPIMDFDGQSLVDMVEACKPSQVNIGGDSGNNNLPEPSKEKILWLIEEISNFTDVVQKKNLKRLLC